MQALRTQAGRVPITCSVTCLVRFFWRDGHITHVHGDSSSVRSCSFLPVTAGPAQAEGDGEEEEQSD